MSNLITWIIAVPIIAAGIYILVKSFKSGVKGEGCSGCSGCSSADNKTCDHDSKL